MYAMPMYWPWVWYSMWLEAATKTWAPAAERMEEVAEETRDVIKSNVTAITPAAAAVGLDMPSPQEIATNATAIGLKKPRR